jgi:hypothetical protein
VHTPSPGFNCQHHGKTEKRKNTPKTKTPHSEWKFQKIVGLLRFASGGTDVTITYKIEHI